jgi:hypothetical protein
VSGDLWPKTKVVILFKPWKTGFWVARVIGVTAGHVTRQIVPFQEWVS